MKSTGVGREPSVSTDTDTDPVSLLNEAPAGFAGDSAAVRWAGERIPRVEDERLITGHGRYVDDLQKPGTVPAAFVRSTVARCLLSVTKLSRRSPENSGRSWMST
jgi:hypothetical protein